MPLYEYQCGDCLSLHEINHKISEASPTDCPACGASALRKKISRTAFVLKGSGWYTDGYSGKSNQKASKETAADTSSPAPTAPEASKKAAPISSDA